MFNFCNLYSGSSGNCSYVESVNSKILIDCGVSCKKVTEALNSINVDFNLIDAIILTHEHLDHVKGLQVICKKYNIPIYANEKTFEGIKQNIPEDNKKLFKTNEKFEIKDLEIFPFRIPHDANDPCGFTINHGDKKISIATDIGHMTSSILSTIQGSSFLLLESNYEPEMLKSSHYPYLLKKRILGPNGHLSNEDAGLAISSLVGSGINNITLGHLSQHNNFPELAYKTVMESLISSKVNLDKLSLGVASRSEPDSLINIA
ncbi:MAG: MBL fold metallo-hydrolase [Clostridia bacterium]|nr:MBL fold metallo-hydrolase [Clostridia bacterium]